MLLIQNGHEQRLQRTSSQQPQGTGAAAAEQQPDQLAASIAAAAAAAAAAAIQLTSPQPARSSLVRVLCAQMLVLATPATAHFF